MNKVKIAELCHETNKAYCESIGDDSQVGWNEAEQWQKDSAINGVEFHSNNETTPEQSHENWIAEKEAGGWVFGLEKNVENKTHPCMLPYSELPVEQKSKDHIFRSICVFFKKNPAPKAVVGDSNVVMINTK